MASGSTHGTRTDLVISDKVFECSRCIKKGKQEEAKNFCQECDSYLCGSCTVTHDQFPPLQSHKKFTAVDIKRVCGLCDTGKGKQKKAIFFCKECGSWICDECKESHEDFPDLQTHTRSVVSRNAMSRPDSSAPCAISVRLGQLSTKSSKGDSFQKANRGTKPRNIDENEKSHSPTEQSADCVTSKVSTTHSTDSQTVQHDIYNLLLASTVKKIQEINVKVSDDRHVSSISSCCFMPGGELVLCDSSNYKIKLLDRSLSVTGSQYIGVTPAGVAAIDNNNVIVTLNYENKLQFLQVLPYFKIGRTIIVDENCYGAAVVAGKIFVSFYSIDTIDKLAEIRVYDLEGRGLGKRLGINPDGSYMFRKPFNIAVSRSGDKIFVSDEENNTVSCLTIDGKMVYQYRDKELKSPRGLFVDGNDSAVVCYYYSRRIEVITAGAQKHATLLTSKDGISCPNCVSFRTNDGTFAVGCGYTNKLLVYKIT